MHEACDEPGRSRCPCWERGAREEAALHRARPATRELTDYIRALGDTDPVISAEVMAEHVAAVFAPSLVEDAENWRTAEAIGHIVDFTATGFGLQHPPSCRPNLIGCRFNAWLSRQKRPSAKPGRYQMVWVGPKPEFDSMEAA